MALVVMTTIAVMTQPYGYEEKKHRWFRRLDWRTYCAWWVDDDYLDVTWPDACERLEYLTDHGDSRRAFTFRQPYDSAGRRTGLHLVPASKG